MSRWLVFQARREQKGTVLCLPDRFVLLQRQEEHCPYDNVFETFKLSQIIRKLSLQCR